MATVDQTGPVVLVPRTSAATRRHGQETLAEVVMIRPARATDTARRGLLGSLITMARVFASPRHQATSVRHTPRPPSSPALRCILSGGSPNDAA